MEVCVPHFYFEFHCLASHCSDSCCSGWEIDIDKETEAFYKQVPGDFGNKLRENIVDGHFRLLPKDKCPFLDKDNLCEIFKNLGENSLCEICKEHPRFKEWFGSYKEVGIGLCCEEAVRLLLLSPTFTLKKFKTDEPEEVLSNDALLFLNKLLNHRDSIFNLIQDSQNEFSFVIEKSFQVANNFQNKEFDFPFESYPSTCNALSILNEWIEILSQTESYGESWDIALKSIKKNKKEILKNPPKNFTLQEIKNLLCYGIFRYYAKSFYDGICTDKLKFALFFCILTNLFCDELNNSFLLDKKINAVKLLSKQLEYSEDNMDFLFSQFNSNPIFSIDNFILVAKHFLKF